jgi:hypothetical protein
MSRGTTIRAVRVPDDPWVPALERAQREGTTLSDVIREHLDEYAHPDEE